jgi:hypothetical protein
VPGAEILIDTHAARIAESVWERTPYVASRTRGALASPNSAISWWRPDCLAGHVRLELRLVFSIIALLKVNSGAKQAPAEELLTASIPKSSAVRKSPNDSMAVFLALDSNQPAIQPTQRAVDRAAVPLPRPRPKRL